MSKEHIVGNHMSRLILGCTKQVKITYREWAVAGKPVSGHLLVENKMTNYQTIKGNFLYNA